MIRTVCLFLLLAAGDTLSAQQCICWRRDKVTQLIFSSEVVKFRAGYTSNDAVSQSDGPVLYIQPVDSLAESNLNVITADGCYYAFNVIYDSTAAMVNYIITPSDGLLSGKYCNASCSCRRAAAGGDFCAHRRA